LKKPFIVGITGGSASGKTTFLKRLCEQFHENELCLVSQDNYYRVRSDQPMDFNGVENYDTPESIDIDSFVEDLKSLINHKEVTRKEYTFNNPKSDAKEIRIFPASVIVIEGIFIFGITEVAELIDLKVFIDAKEHVKLQRRIHRDLVERNYELDDVLYRYQHHVSIAYEKYVLPYKDSSDLVVPNNHGFDAALEVMVYYLKSKIH
jgi:uridine kinase